MKKIKLLLLFILLIVAFIIVGIFVWNRDRMTFPPTFVLNLDERTDRMKEIRDEFRNWPAPVERISAIRMSPGWKGCSASHLKCIQIAKERNYPWVLILEDDCILTANASQRFQSLLPFLWKNRNRWDMFNGGLTYLKHHTKVSQNPPIYEVYGFTTNFYIVHNSVYDRVLNGYPIHPDNFEKAIDVYYADTFRIWTSTPYLSKQRPGKSDIGEKPTEDYTDLFDTAERTLLQS
jgi:GR25 family glycosyltransferase involved in LPS biosynthesis